MFKKIDLDTRFIKACVNHGDGTESGNFKKANKAANQIYDVVTELKNQNNLQYLVQFLQHENDSVKLWSAGYLLNLQPEIALSALQTIMGRPKSLVSFSAEVTFSEWQKGTLKMYFKD
ncbi:DUF2019 domain-containing protein [Paenibacillus sp. N3.4]|uniref:DUF2019 domain-containing protein n=1 Tax=Paenibacillus sp. N3.4 TaxID=2603222 RepID=UPI001650A30B|nr:DUF2019 domain-containing protein [Paenibacillus sp. N3.4]